MAHLDPYLIFSGNAEEAFNFYKSVFGGEFTTVSRLGDAPSDPSHPISEAEKNLIMHISLPIGGGSVLMASDAPSFMGTVTRGNGLDISINAATEEEGHKLFNGLSAGGTVKMPFEKMFWGAFHGQLDDKFGVAWMVNYDPNQKPA